MVRGIVAVVVAVCLLANVPRLSSVHAAAAHPSIVLVKPRCYGHAPQTGSAPQRESAEVGSQPRA